MSSSPSRSRMELMVAATAFFVSICTLAVYIYQAKVMREQQHVSVWPYVEWNTGDVKDYHMRAQNKGVGPAIIRKVEMALDGRPVASNSALLEAVLGKDWQLTSWVNSTLEGRVLIPGEEVTFLQIPDPKEGRDFESKLHAHRFDLRITYCSVYGDCWVTNGDQVMRLPKQELGLY